MYIPKSSDERRLTNEDQKKKVEAFAPRSRTSSFCSCYTVAFIRGEGFSLLVGIYLSAMMSEVESMKIKRRRLKPSPQGQEHRIFVAVTR